MQTLVIVITLGVIAGAVAWVVIVLRKYQARKRVERQREERFLADMMRAPPRPEAAAAPAGPQAAAPQPAAPADPLAAAAESIGRALSAGRGADAAKAFLAVLAERTRLALEPPVWEALGRALLAQGAFMEAAWALHAGAALAGDTAGAQKRLLEVATRAGDAGQPHNALKLYATLLAKYPQSQYADFVRASMKEQERRVPKPGP